MLYFLREFCETSSVLKVIMFIQELLKIVFFVVPIGLIIMLSVDLAKNVITGKEDEMKKNVNVAIKRVIMAVVIFFIPTIVNFVNGIVQDSVGGNLDYNECLTNANKEYITIAESEEKTEKYLEALNRKSNTVEDIETKNAYTAVIGSGLNGSSLPTDDSYYPLKGKDENGNALKYLEIGNNYLTDAEMEELNEFIWESVNSSDDWGTRVATAAYSLAYGLAQKGLVMHYQKAGWANDDGTTSVENSVGKCEMNGYCKNWGRLLTSTGINRALKYGNYVNVAKDYSNNGGKNGKYYSGLDCTGLVKWAIRTGCGTSDISDKLYQNSSKFPRGKKGDIDVAQTGDVLITDGHVKLFLKHNSDGTYMTVEATSGSNLHGVVFQKSTKNDLKGYSVIKMHEKWDQYCKKTS